MLLADSNVWLALTLSKHELHPVARDWFGRQKLPNVLMFCRATQQSFLRLLTTSAVATPYGIPPLTNRAAWSLYETLRADKRISWVPEPPDLDLHWKKLSASSKPSPKLWMDAYLAAFAIAAGYRIVTTDRAFKQFKALDSVVLSKP